MVKFQFDKTGQGPVIILLHGFCLGPHIWQDLITGLSKKFAVYNLAFPVVSQTSLQDQKPDFALLGAHLTQFLTFHKISSATIIGHSMGGYLGISFLKQFPEKVDQLILLHSTAEADKEDRIIQRKKSLDFVEKHGPAALMQSFIPLLFYDDFPKIEEIITKAKKTDVFTFKWYTHAMLNRAEQLDVIEETHKKIAFIAGEHDIIMPVNDLLNQARLNSKHEFYMLENSAHMGMLEQPEKLLPILNELMIQQLYSFL